MFRLLNALVVHVMLVFSDNSASAEFQSVIKMLFVTFR